MLPTQIGYRAYSQRQGVRLKSRVCVDYWQKEQKKTPAPCSYDIKQSVGQARKSTIHPKADYRGIFVPDNF